MATIKQIDAESLETLTQEYVNRFHPTTPEQRHFIDILIRDDWLRRLAKVATQLWEYELTFPLKRDENAPAGRAYASGSTIFFGLQRRMDAAVMPSVPRLASFLINPQSQFSPLPPRDGITTIGPYTLAPADLFKTPSRGFPK